MLLGNPRGQPAAYSKALPGKKVPTVSGSSQALIFIPIVVMAALAVWLILVFYADSHPGWGAHHSPELTGAVRASAVATSEAPRATAAHDGAPAPGVPPRPVGPQP